MNKNEKLQYCESKIEEIKNLNVEIIKSDIDNIIEASNDLDTNRMIEAVDSIIDEYYCINFKTNKEQDFELIETIEGIKIFDIGNGLKGFEYNNVRYTDIKDLENAIGNDELFDNIQDRI